MTTDIATIDDGRALAPVAAADDPFDSLMRYAELLDVAYKFAERVCRTTIVPKIYQGKPQDAAVAIMHGGELGLNPLQALQNVFPVHGMPSIYAKTMVAKLRQKGYRFTTHEAGPERVVFQGWAPDGDTETSEWTIERATRAGFVPTIDPETGKYKTKKLTGPNGAYEKMIGNEKYILQPEEMLWAKAATTVCKRLASHILLGLEVAEDQEDRIDETEPVRVESERVQPQVIAVAGGGGGVSSHVRQWTPPPAAEGGSTAGISQPAPENPESNSETASDPGEKQDTAQVDEPDPPAEFATAAEQRALSGELERHGHKTAAAKRKWLSADTGREIASAKELTSVEANAIIARLQRREAGDAPILRSQWAQAAQLLDQLGADTDEKKVLFLRSFLPGREQITDPLDLNEREAAEVLTELTQLVADEGQQQTLDTEAGAQ
jgi:hypothetical protein